MLGDVELDWSLPPGYAIRAVHQTDGKHRRPAGLRPAARPQALSRLDAGAARAGPTAGRRCGRARPRERRGGAHARATPARLRPALTRAHAAVQPALVLGLSHQPPARRPLRRRPGLRRRRCCPHPPADRSAGHEHGHPGRLQPRLEARPGGRGACAADGLLDTYHAERHPVGEEVVGRTVRAARAEFGADRDDADDEHPARRPAARRLPREPAQRTGRRRRPTRRRSPARTARARRPWTAPRSHGCSAAPVRAALRPRSRAAPLRGCGRPVGELRGARTAAQVRALRRARSRRRRPRPRGPSGHRGPRGAVRGGVRRLRELART